MWANEGRINRRELLVCARLRLQMLARDHNHRP
jgi:hypothetical protein